MKLQALLAGAAALLLGSFVAFYLLSGKGGLAQWAALLVGVAAAVAVFGVSEAGKQLVAFGRDAWRETKKVVWPARKEAIQMTAYVFAFVFVMSLFLWLTGEHRAWPGGCRRGDDDSERVQAAGRATCGSGAPWRTDPRLEVQRLCADGARTLGTL